MGLLQAMCAIIYYHVGVVAHKYNVFSYGKNWIALVSAAILYVLSFILGGKVVFASCRFPSPVINLLGAVSFVFLLYFGVSNQYTKTWRPLEYLGRISMLVLTVHAFDIDLGVSTRIGLILGHLSNADWRIVEFISRLVFAVYGSMTLCRMSLVRKVFNIPAPASHPSRLALNVDTQNTEI